MTYSKVCEGGAGLLLQGVQRGVQKRPCVRVTRAVRNPKPCILSLSPLPIKEGLTHRVGPSLISRRGRGKPCADLGSGQVASGVRRMPMTSR